jgi:dihydropteroate synthase
MGIVNVNDDSFCGDGTLDPAEAVEIAARHVADGADIIDVGAESARTNRAPIATSDEIRRVRRFIDALDARGWDLRPRFPDQLFPPLLSLNTWRSEVVAAVLAPRFDILNDIGGLRDEQNARLCAEAGAALVIMHSVGEPKVPHTHVRHPHVVSEVVRFFEEKLALAEAAGVPRDGVILDPGVDFAKQRTDNLLVLRHLDRIAELGRPVLLPVSRKTVIGETLGIKTPAGRDAGTMACLVAGQLRGAAIFRVHNVRAAAEAVRIVDAVEAGRLRPEASR